MKIETEIKLILTNINVKELIKKIENTFNLKSQPIFHQKTYQFFLSDYTKQTIFPRIRNEENGSKTLTLKAKIQDEINSDYFKRIELETEVSDVNSASQMMELLGFTKKVTWEKNRINFTADDKEKKFTISLDETPMGYFLEIESSEEEIETIIIRLGLENLERTKKAYLGVWADYNKKQGTVREDMLFNKI